MTGMTRQGGLVVRIACALALLFLGLAHRPAIEVRVADPLELAYQLPDGNAPDLCVPQSPEKHTISYPACDACRLAAAVILPPAPAVLVYAAPAAKPLYVHFESAETLRHEVRAQAARGPPSFLDA